MTISRYYCSQLCSTCVLMYCIVICFIVFMIKLHKTLSLIYLFVYLFVYLFHLHISKAFCSVNSLCLSRLAQILPQIMQHTIWSWIRLSLSKFTCLSFHIKSVTYWSIFSPGCWFRVFLLGLQYWWNFYIYWFYLFCSVLQTSSASGPATWRNVVAWILRPS